MKQKLFMISIVAILLLSGCGQNEATLATAIAEKVLTSVAQTVEAIPSQTPLPTATELPTSTPTSTETPTPSPTISPTSSPTAPVSFGASSTPSNVCDNASFVSDVSIPDNTQFAPGTAFIKTWRIRNNGTCTWNAKYTVIFTSGTAMSGKSPQEITNQTVAPGETLDISINMVAPAIVGSYTGYWRLQNAENVAFGQAFYVQIQVASGLSTITVTPSPTGSATLGPTATNTTAPTETETPTDTPIP
jgi:hypothetical protein